MKTVHVCRNLHQNSRSLDVFFGVFLLKVLISIKINLTCKNKTNSCLPPVWPFYGWYNIMLYMISMDLSTVRSLVLILNTWNSIKKTQHWVYYNPSKPLKITNVLRFKSHDEVFRFQLGECIRSAMGNVPWQTLCHDRHETLPRELFKKTMDII